MSWPRVICWAIVAVVVVTAVAVIASRVSSCLGEPEGSPVTLQNNPDPRFEDVHSRSYRPPSIPIIEKKARSPLPPGIDEKSVERVLNIHFASRPTPVSIVELKTGEVLIERDSSVSRIEVLDFASPFIAFEARFGLGLSFGPDPGQGWSFRPSASASFIEVAGTVRLPAAVVDTRYFGLALQVRLYHEIWAGAGIFWEYSDLERRSARLLLHYTF